MTTNRLMSSWSSLHVGEKWCGGRLNLPERGRGIAASLAVGRPIGPEVP